jgi:hypothetical protein
MENSLLPCDDWTIKEMKDYIREKKLNKTKIVLLGMKRVDMIEGLKKLKHFQLPSNEIVSKLGCDVSLLHNLIWDIEEMIIKYLNFWRHLYSLSWGQLSKLYRSNYQSQHPGLTCKISRGLTPVKLSNLLVKDFPQLTIKDVPEKPRKEQKEHFECSIELYEDDKEMMCWFKYMMIYFGWTWPPHQQALWNANKDAHFYKWTEKSSIDYEKQKIVVNVLYKNKATPNSNIHSFRILRFTQNNCLFYHTYYGEDD